MAKAALTKNQKRRAREKAKKQDSVNEPEGTTNGDQSNGITKEEAQPPKASNNVAQADTTDDDALTAERVQLLGGVSVDDPLYEQFAGVLKRFGRADDDLIAAREKEKGEVMGQDDDGIPDDDEEQEKENVASRKRLKKLHQLSVAELKAIARRPELVEWSDANAIEPGVLVEIKSSKNVVPVPPHWNLKRDYLSTKRGLDQSAFRLPKFIQETGIAEMRDAAMEKDKEASLKQKQRERVQPKMGRLDIDYQKLWEAFFRRQTKPNMTRFGESYYEGKEYEVNLRHLKPGNLSDELLAALNISPETPPPWLVKQQEFGPPPSYPALKIPGVNAPIPPGAQWGWEQGQWGKLEPSSDGKPPWGGDPYGVAQFHQHQDGASSRPADLSHWGELEVDDDEEEEMGEDSEEEADDEDDEEEAEQDQEDLASGLRTQSGFTSVEPTRKTENVSPKQEEEEQSVGRRTAGQVISEQQRSSTGFFGSDRGYDLRGAQGHTQILGQEERGRKRKAGDVDVSLDPESMSKEQLQAHYDEQSKKQSGLPWAQIDQEDLSAMIAEEHNKRRKKDEERRARR